MREASNSLNYLFPHLLPALGCSRGTGREQIITFCQEGNKKKAVAHCLIAGCVSSSPTVVPTRFMHCNREPYIDAQTESQTIKWWSLQPHPASSFKWAKYRGCLDSPFWKMENDRRSFTHLAFIENMHIKGLRSAALHYGSTHLIELIECNMDLISTFMNHVIHFSSFCITIIVLWLATDVVFFQHSLSSASWINKKCIGAIRWGVLFGPYHNCLFLKTKAWKQLRVGIKTLTG